MIGFILVWVLIGLIVGALGRLALPGPNPMSIGATVGVGVAGALVSGIICYALGFRRPSLIVAVLVTAGIIWLMQRNRPGARRVP